MSKIKRKISYIILFCIALTFTLFGFIVHYTKEPINAVNIKIKDGYLIWNFEDMNLAICAQSYLVYGNSDASAILNRSYRSMYIEWWAHNIGYYLTKPFCFFERINQINLRCKDIDIERWTEDELFREP